MFSDFFNWCACS